MRKAGTSTVCADRSLSSECGSVTASTPRTNSPAGTSTDVPADAGPPRRQRGAAIQQRRPGPQVQRLQHGLVVLVLVADHQPEGEVRLAALGRNASRLSSALLRTVAQYGPGLRPAKAAAGRRDWRGSSGTRRSTARPAAREVRAGRGCCRAAATVLPASRCARGPTPAGSSAGRTGGGVRRRRSRPVAACGPGRRSARARASRVDVTVPLAPIA